jgi:hypothetical protein
MTDKEIMDMCRRLANKYGSHQDRGDLLNTGMVVCLDLRASGVKEPAKLYHRARDAMNDFMNHGSSPLTYPSGQRGRQKFKDDESVEYVEYQDEAITAKSLFEAYELKECLQKLMQVLEPQEKLMLMELHRNNNNLQDAAKVLKVSRVTATQLRDAVRSKVVTICDLTLC